MFALCNEVILPGNNHDPTYINLPVLRIITMECGVMGRKRTGRNWWKLHLIWGCSLKRTLPPKLQPPLPLDKTPPQNSKIVYSFMYLILIQEIYWISKLQNKIHWGIEWNNVVHHVMLLCCQMLWFYHLCVTGPSKRSSRRETRWHSRTSNHSSPPSIIRHPPTHRSPDPCRPAGTVTVDRLNPCMTHPCSCPRRCGGGPPAPRTWAWRTRPPLLVRLGDSSKVCSDAKVSLDIC